MLASEGESRAERFRRGEPEVISAVARLARHMVGEKGYFVPLDDREDLVQEILIHVHRALSEPGFQLRHGLEAFIRVVAHRRCVDWMRRYKPVDPIDAEAKSTNPGPERVLLSKERIARGVLVLRALGSSCLELIRLRVRDGLSYREMAARLARTEGGIRSQMYKCLKRARLLLEQAGGTAPQGAGK